MDNIAETAKDLLTERNCMNCRWNLIHSGWNQMKIEECGWWYHNQRGSEKALNPPDVKKIGACKLWKQL